MTNKADVHKEHYDCCQCPANEGADLPHHGTGRSSKLNDDCMLVYAFDWMGYRHCDPLRAADRNVISACLMPA